MKVIELSNKVYLTRHWLKWYFVKRGGQEWEPVGKVKNRKRTRPFSIERAAKALSDKHPLAGNTLFDEQAADDEVKKNRPKK